MAAAAPAPAPGPGAAPGAAGIPPVGAGARGTDTILLDLRTGRHQLLGSVGDIAFNRTGTLLAYTVDAAVKDGNGLFVFDTRSGRIVTLDNDAWQYKRLAWNEDADAIAVLKGKDVEKMREKDNVLVVFTDVPAAIGLDDIAPTPVLFDPTEGRQLPQGLGRERPRRAAVERGQQAHLLRDQGAGRRARHDATDDRRAAGRGRLEHRSTNASSRCR